MKVYVRRSIRFIDGDYLDMLDVANIEVYKKYQRQGLFNQFMKIAESLNPWNGLYLESILNPVLMNWCLRHQWSRFLYLPAPYTFYKLKK